MKKLLVIGLIAFTLLTLPACSGNNYTDENTTLTQADVGAVMENLAGEWALLNYGILVDVQMDGTWWTSWGDIEFRGKVELTQDNGNYITEFIILEQRGPGAMYDGYGNIREEAFNVETYEFYWMAFPSEYNLWLLATFSVDYDRLVHVNLGQEMERIR